MLDVFTSGFWKDLSAVEDDSLWELALRLGAAVLASCADQGRRMPIGDPSPDGKSLQFLNRSSSIFQPRQNMLPYTCST